MKYFLTFILLATFMARKKLVRMLEEQVKDNDDLEDLVTNKEETAKTNYMEKEIKQLYG